MQAVMQLAARAKPSMLKPLYIGLEGVTANDSGRHNTAHLTHAVACRPSFSWLLMLSLACLSPCSKASARDSLLPLALMASLVVKVGAACT